MSKDCAAQGGAGDGSCAAGFGTCCVVNAVQCGATVRCLIGPGTSSTRQQTFPIGQFDVPFKQEFENLVARARFKSCNIELCSPSSLPDVEEEVSVLICQLV